MKILGVNKHVDKDGMHIAGVSKDTDQDDVCAAEVNGLDGTKNSSFANKQSILSKIVGIAF